MARTKKIKIDKDMRPLIEAMNATGWIETVSCCQGHPRSEYHQTPYVAFYCKSSKIKLLCRMLNQVERIMENTMNEYIWFDLSIVHNEEVNGCQDTARRGWLALNLDFDEDRSRVKKTVIELLTEQFITAGD